MVLRGSGMIRYALIGLGIFVLVGAFNSPQGDQTQRDNVNRDLLIGLGLTGGAYFLL